MTGRPREKQRFETGRLRMWHRFEIGTSSRGLLDRWNDIFEAPDHPQSAHENRRVVGEDKSEYHGCHCQGSQHPLPSGFGANKDDPQTQQQQFRSDEPKKDWIAQEDGLGGSEPLRLLAEDIRFPNGNRGHRGCEGYLQEGQDDRYASLPAAMLSGHASGQ